MRILSSTALAVALLAVCQFAFASSGCPTVNEIVAGADRTENLLLEFARAYARSAGLPDLRKLRPSPGEMHVRLWHGFGLTGVDGFVLERSGATWTAHVVAPVGQSGCYAQREVSTPTDWAPIWQRIEALGLAALPSTPYRAPNLLVADGYSYVLEWWQDGRYRTFVYDNPDVFKTPEDARMLAIARHLLGAAGGRRPAESK